MGKYCSAVHGLMRNLIPTSISAKIVLTVVTRVYDFSQLSELSESRFIMGGKLRYSSRKELKRKAQKRDELRKYKEQLKDDSVIYCDRVAKERQSGATGSKNASKVMMKTSETKRTNNGARRLHHYIELLKKAKAQECEHKVSAIQHKNGRKKHFSARSGNTTDVEKTPNSQENTLYKEMETQECETKGDIEENSAIKDKNRRKKLSSKGTENTKDVEKIPDSQKNASSMERKAQECEHKGDIKENSAIKHKNRRKKRSSKGTGNTADIEKIPDSQKTALSMDMETQECEPKGDIQENSTLKHKNRRKKRSSKGTGNTTDIEKIPDAQENSSSMKRTTQECEHKGDIQENSAIKHKNRCKKRSSKGSGNTTNVEKMPNSGKTTLSKTQRKPKNPRRIVGITNENWGHVQGRQFALKTLNRKTLVIFDPTRKEYNTTEQGTQNKVLIESVSRTAIS